MKDNLEKNKENAIEFYKMAFNGNPKEATHLYVGATYIQHNPVIEDGIGGFINYFNKMYTQYPNKSIEFVRSIAQGNLVALHTHQIWPDNDEYITMDFFKFDSNGKIVEHWDSIQKIPESSANNNKMY